MTNQEIWEKACERVGMKGVDDSSHRVNYPPIRDPACVVAMLKYYLSKHWGDMTIGSKPLPEPFFFVVGCPQGGETLELALASAVIAIPVEKANAES